MRKKWIAIGLAISSFLITTSPYLSISADPLSDLQAQKTSGHSHKSPDVFFVMKQASYIPMISTSLVLDTLLRRSLP